MPSPFPGMNPYLEHHDDWQNFHNHFCAVAVEALTAQVRGAYLVKLNEQVYIHELPDDTWRSVGRPDVSVLGGSTREPAPAPNVAVLDRPVKVRLETAVDMVRVVGLEIRSRLDRDLVTAIELLSPTNKTNVADRELYAAKRPRLLTSSAHFVEIDLLRGGTRPQLGKPLPRCEYCALVSRVEGRPDADYWPIRLRDWLPTVPIPLRDGGEATLDLQALLHRVYDAGTYADEIYTRPPEPPLSAADAKWAKKFVPKRA